MDSQSYLSDTNIFKTSSNSITIKAIITKKAYLSNLTLFVSKYTINEAMAVVRIGITTLVNKIKQINKEKFFFFLASLYIFNIRYYIIFTHHSPSYT